MNMAVTLQCLGFEFPGRHVAMANVRMWKKAVLGFNGFTNHSPFEGHKTL